MADIIIDGTTVINKTGDAITQTFPGPNHTFTVKAVNQPITDSQTGTTPDVANSTSDQLAIYNGSTKLWGVTENGYVVTPLQPYFVAYVDSSYSYGSVGTGNPFPANASPVNVGNHYSTSTYRFTAPITGQYLFTWSSLHNNNGGSSRPGFYVNGNRNLNGVAHGLSGSASNGNYANATSCIIKLSAGDYVTVQTDAGSLYYYQKEHSSFSGMLLG